MVLSVSVGWSVWPQSPLDARFTSPKPDTLVLPHKLSSSQLRCLPLAVCGTTVRVSAVLGVR
jgi:hypothetical protein